MAIKDSQQRANAKYRAKAYDRLETMVRKDGEDGFTVEELDRVRGDKSRRQFMLEAVREKIEREK